MTLRKGQCCNAVRYDMLLLLGTVFGSLGLSLK